MTNFPFKSAQFKRSVFSVDKCPSTMWPEIVLIGRSNVGKSSLLNHFLGTKKLAKTSSRPGKTQSINFFSVDDRLSLVDLPGYGYAAAPGHTRKNWGPLIQKYLSSRNQITLLLILLDIRRTPSTLDIEMLQWAEHFQRPFLIIFTKTDKLSSHMQNTQIQKNLAAFKQYEIQPKTHLRYTVHSLRARQQLINTLNTLLTRP